MKEHFTVSVDFALPIAVAILAIFLAIGHQTLTTKSSIAPLQLELSQSYITESAALREVDALTKELQSYQATTTSLIRLGATPAQAKCVIKAAEVHSVSPKS